MRKIILFSFLILFFSCEKADHQIIVSSDLTKRTLLFESYDPNITSYVSDSIIEHYENKLIKRRDYYYKINVNASYNFFYQTFEYNQSNFLIKIKSFRDSDLNEHYASKDYYYNLEENLYKENYNKFAASNVSNTLFDKSTHYQYVSDSIKTFSIDHLNGDLREDLETYVTYGNLDSIKSVNSEWMTFFDRDIGNYKTKYIGDSPNDYSWIERESRYGASKEPLIDDIFGSQTNSFLARNNQLYHFFEFSKKYLQDIYYHSSGDRNDNIRTFNYTFDTSDRLLEINTGGTFISGYTIKYFYD